MSLHVRHISRQRCGSSTSMYTVECSKSYRRVVCCPPARRATETAGVPAGWSPRESVLLVATSRRFLVVVVGRFVLVHRHPHSVYVMAATALLPVLLLCWAVALAGSNYVIYSQRFSADPSPIVYNGRVYLYTTHDGAGATAMTDYNCISSTDMVNWRDEGIVFSMENTSWAKGLKAWAQQVVQLRNGTFVMVFPAVGRNSAEGVARGGIGVASAAHPAGPFKQASADRLPETVGGDDPTIFIDENITGANAQGQTVLCVNRGPVDYHNASAMCGVLNDDLVGWKTPPEVLGGMNRTKWHYFEAPWLMRRRGSYFLSYMMEYADCPGNGGKRIPNATAHCPWSHGGFDIGYSMASAVDTDSSSVERRSPRRRGALQAQWEPKGTLLWSNDWSGVSGGNIHQGIVEFPVGSDLWYLFYHSVWLSGRSRGWERNVGVDRLYFNDSDPAAPTMLPVTVTPGWMRAAVKYLSPYASPVPAFTIAQASDGIFTRTSGDSGKESVAELRERPKQLCIDGIQDGGWTLTRQVDFGTPSSVANSQNVTFIFQLRVMVPPCEQGD